MKRLIALLVFFLLVAITTLSLTVFFKTEKVEIAGTTRYNHEEIVEKSGVVMGENLIMLNTAEVGETLKEEFVYIEDVRVKKNIFTGTAQIIIEEAVPFCTLTTDEGYYLISRGGTVLERLSDKPEDMYTVTGLSITEEMIGTKLNSEGDEQLSILEEILAAIESTGITKITEIDLGDVLNIVLNYDNRIDVEFGTRTDGLTQNVANAYDTYYLANPYLQLIEEGKVGTEELDDKARRVLRLIFRTSMNPNKPYGSLVSEEHLKAAREIGEEGIVLLKNDNHTLPISLEGKPRIVVVGENAVKMMTVGGGSSSLKVAHEVSPLEGLHNIVGDRAEIVWVRGYIGDVNGKFDGVVAAQNLAEERSEEELIREAVEAAAQGDYVILFGGLNKSKHQDCEGADRRGLELPYAQNKLVEALAEVSKKFIYVNISGNAVAMPWVESVPAIVQGWYLGSEAGNSLARVLIGDVCPSGKLPFTFPVKLEDSAAHAVGEYGTRGEVNYSEGILVGYRWHEAKDIPPLFAFGHGLSYTTFDYSKARLSKRAIRRGESVVVSVDVTNNGSVDGAEVVQVYVGDVEAPVLRPEKELKGFEKVFVKAGQTKRVKIVLPKEAFEYFDDKAHEWRADKGDFKVYVAAASDDVRATLDLKLK